MGIPTFASHDPSESEVFRPKHVDKIPHPTIYRTVSETSDGTAPRDLAKILSKPDVATLQYDSDHEKEPIALSINAYVINTGSHWVLIDTGASELFGRTSGKLISNMRAAGIDPKQIDIVLLTHIHADHFGGLTVGGIMQFPNATVYVDKRDVDSFVTRSVTLIPPTCSELWHSPKPE